MESGISRASITAMHSMWPSSGGCVSAAGLALPHEDRWGQQSGEIGLHTPAPELDADADISLSIAATNV